MARALPLALAALALAGCIAAPQPPLQELQASPGWLQGAVWDLTGNYSRTLVRGPFEVLDVERVDIASFDATPIAAALWRPAVPPEQRVPVVLSISPYWAADLAGLGDRVGEFYLDNLVRHGYAFAKVAVRGTSESGGCMESMGPSEQRDIDEVVTWFGTRPWSTGAVAVMGKSYVGTTPWVAASFGNPHLRTIVPISGVTSWGELGFRNGTAEPRAPVHMPLYWAAFGVMHDAQSVSPRAPERTCEETLLGAGAGAWGTATGETASPPLDADYWKVRDFRERVLASYRGSVFLVHGLDDWNVNPSQAFPFLTQLEQAGLTTKVLLGQWAHDWPDEPYHASELKRWDFAELLLRWLDRHLKGLPVDTGPAVDVQDSRGAWRNETAWPPRDAALVEMHLGDGTLETEPTAPGQRAAAPNPAGAVDAPRCGPRAGVEGLHDDAPFAWVFTSDPYLLGLRFAGLPQVHVTVVPSSPLGGQLSAELLDLDGTGVRRVAHGSMHLRFHEGGDEPQQLTPGQPVLARMELEPADVALAPGHRLALRLVPDGMTGACAPLSAPNTIHEGTLPGVGPGPLELRWGEGASVLRLPLIERGQVDGRYPGQP